jgi:hypothetical protein
MLSVIMLSVIMLSVVMLNVVMLNVVMLSVVMPSVVRLNAVAPSKFVGTTFITKRSNFEIKKLFVLLGGKKFSEQRYCLVFFLTFKIWRFVQISKIII